jgi:Ohr subfamily peroxiredoxin
MSVNVLYTTAARATGGRDGQAGTLDGNFSVHLATPKELGGAGGEGSNPEQLFASGYAACFIGAMKFVSSQGGTAKVPADATVTATVARGLPLFQRDAEQYRRQAQRRLRRGSRRLGKARRHRWAFLLDSRFSDGGARGRVSAPSRRSRRWPRPPSPKQYPEPSARRSSRGAPRDW